MVRVKNRYLLVDIMYPTAKQPDPLEPLPDLILWNQPTTDFLTPGKLVRAIRDVAKDMFGDYGLGALGTLQVKYLSNATSTAILRISREHYRLLWASLFNMDRIPVRDGEPAIFRVVRVSGTMRKAQQECIRRARQIVLAVKDHETAQPDDALDSIFGGKRQNQGVVLGDIESNDDGDSNDAEMDEDG